MSDPDNEGFELNPARKDHVEDTMLARLFFVVLIWIMLNLASTVLGFLTVVQYVIMLVHKGEPNARLADFGTDLGIWIAKAVRYQTAASDVKPWPWSELD